MNKLQPPRKWYKMKRYWELTLLVIWLVFAYSEGPKLRYEPEA